MDKLTANSLRAIFTVLADELPAPGPFDFLGKELYMAISDVRNIAYYLDKGDLDRAYERALDAEACAKKNANFLPTLTWLHLGMVVRCLEPYRHVPVNHVIAINANGNLEVDGVLVLCRAHFPESEWPELLAPTTLERIYGAIYDHHQCHDGWKTGDTFSFEGGEPLFQAVSFHIEAIGAAKAPIEAAGL